MSEVTQEPLNVSFVTHSNPSIASFRYRAMAPAAVLENQGHKVTVGYKADPDSSHVVFSKHWVSNDVAYARFCRLRGQIVVYDVCDDHFHDKYESHYRDMIRQAQVITVNSLEMGKVIKEKTGKKFTVIPDPVLSIPAGFKEGLPPRLLWYGNFQNLPGLLEVVQSDYLKYNSEIPLEVIIGDQHPSLQILAEAGATFTQWHPNCIPEAARRNSIALIPYRQDKPAKSANRVLEAIQSGLFVMTDMIPAVKGIPGVWDLKKGFKEGIEFYLSGKAQEAVQEGQEYAREFYPSVIVEKWKKVFV